MNALDTMEEIKSCIAAMQELTQQVIDLSCYPDQMEKINAIDTARIATQEKLNWLFPRFESYLRYGLKIDAIEQAAQKAE